MRPLVAKKSVLVNSRRVLHFRDGGKEPVNAIGKGTTSVVPPVQRHLPASAAEVRFFDAECPRRKIGDEELRGRRQGRPQALKRILF